MNYRKILADNVLALMRQNPELNSHAKLAKHCSTPTRKIGARTIGHLLDWDGGINPKLDTIIAVAEAFKVPPWMLLTPDFDPQHKIGGRLPPPEVIALAERILRNREALGDIFNIELDTDFTRGAHIWTAPVAVHEPKSVYGTRRQPKLPRTKSR